jgi:hypothetical protein
MVAKAIGSFVDASITIPLIVPSPKILVESEIPNIFVVRRKTNKKHIFFSIVMALFRYSSA